MKLNRLVICNFYSHANTTINFSEFEPGVVNIYGINKDTGGSNGAGKSIIFEAVLFSLFNKTIRKSTEEAIVNVYEGAGCSVRLELEQEGIGAIVIERRKRPTGLDVWVNGESVIKESQVRTQEYLEELLDINYKSFCASVVFGQHSDIDFLSASKEDKRLIIKNCLNLDIIFEYRSVIKDFKSAAGMDLKSTDLLLNELNDQLNELESKNPVVKKYKYIEIPPLSEILYSEKKIREFEDLIRETTKKSRLVEDRINKLEELVVIGVSEDIKECPICKSSYKKVQTQEDVDAAKLNISSLTKDLDTYSTQIKLWTDCIASTTPKISSKLWDKYNEKNKLCENSKIIIEQIDSLKNRISINNAKKQELEKRIEVLKYWERAFSEQGLLKYIIKNILDYLNLQINKYISTLTNNQFSILFDEELIETIVTNNKVISYMSLSGGEKKKINLAVMLGLQSIQSIINKNNINMIFFDEIAESIDESGISGIYNLLNSYKDEGKLIFLITHNELLKSMLESYQSITIIKSRGISRLKED
jgi:DNA repair exonuclease SbcCD ATPase subunit